VSIGGRKDMSAMLRFAAQHNIVATTEIFPMSDINRALEKLRNNQVKYRIVLENPVWTP
jgi:D-arabinose 1-dehydrogenase-like Zn-dependent alcohol dehydrogenase